MKGVLFITYASLIAKKTKPKKGEIPTRLEQVLLWAGRENYDGLIIFDESHKAKNLIPENGKPTKTGQTVQRLQEMLPNARVVYASATGASDPKNLGYMSRLGLWGEGAPFSDLGKFLDFVEENGVGAMELVALDLKWQGIFLARQLSFAGCTFQIREIEMDKHYTAVYNESVELVIIFRILIDTKKFCKSEWFKLNDYINFSPLKYFSCKFIKN